MARVGYEPKALVVPFSLLKEACGSEVSPEEAIKLMRFQGYVSQSQGVDILVADIPPGSALLTTAPPLVGFYTRTGEHLGLLLQRADRTLMMVRHVVD